MGGRQHLPLARHEGDWSYCRSSSLLLLLLAGGGRGVESLWGWFPVHTPVGQSIHCCEELPFIARSKCGEDATPAWSLYLNFIIGPDRIPASGTPQPSWVGGPAISSSSLLLLSPVPVPAVQPPSMGDLIM